MTGRESPHLTRAWMLLERHRYDEAEKAARQALADQPHHAYSHSVLALCRMHQDDNKQAEQLASQAVALDPEDPFTHYVLGHVRLRMDNAKGAREAAEQAIRLEPAQPNFHSLLASIYNATGRWKEGLATAERGLAFDPDNPNCQSQRTFALTHLGRHDEASEQTLQGLRQNADNPLMHAHRGWNLLHENKPRQALDAFKQAIRLDPGNEYARRGIVEALKARNPLYRAMLAYFLWMARLSPRARGAVIIGAYIFYRLLIAADRDNPDLGPYVRPLMIAYLAFVVLTWVSQPLFNLLLRISPYGRYALSRDQTHGSTAFGIALALALAALTGWLLTDTDPWLRLTLAAAVLILPAAAWYSHHETPAFTHIAVGMALALALALAGFTLSLLTLPAGEALAYAAVAVAILTEVYIIFQGFATRPV